MFWNLVDDGRRQTTWPYSRQRLKNKRQPAAPQKSRCTGCSFNDATLRAGASLRAPTDGNKQRDLPNSSVISTSLKFLKILLLLFYFVIDLTIYLLPAT